MEVPYTMTKVLANAFLQGLEEGDFFQFLVKKPPIDYDKLLGHAKKYINVKEGWRLRRE